VQRLLLVSSGLTAIKDFVTKEPSRLKLLFIPTAGNTYDNIWWIDKDRSVLHELGFKMTDLDIEGTSANELGKAIDNTDIVYIAGGNTFFLLQQLRKTGFDNLIKTFVKNGGLYVGASAGAIIVGPEIEPARQFDDPDHLVDMTSTSGLGLVKFIPFPHYDMADRTQTIQKIVSEYSDKYTVVTMTDDQVIIVNGDQHQVVDSIRTETELNWPR
jgi:dipeptidase E